MSNSLLTKLRPISAGVLSQADRLIQSTPYAPTLTATKFEYGNLNTFGIICGHESFKWFNRLGGAHATHPLLTHVSQGIITLLKDKGYVLAVNYDADHASGIVSFVHPNPTDFMERLTKAGGMATHRDGFIRLSPGIYQSDETLTALGALL